MNIVCWHHFCAAVFLAVVLTFLFNATTSMVRSGSIFRFCVISRVFISLLNYTGCERTTIDLGTKIFVICPLIFVSPIIGVGVSVQSRLPWQRSIDGDVKPDCWLESVRLERQSLPQDGCHKWIVGFTFAIKRKSMSQRNATLNGFVRNGSNSKSKGFR